jgi:hypothetical protein
MERASVLPSEWFEKHRSALVIILGLAILILQIVQLLEGRGPDFTGTAAGRDEDSGRLIYISGAVVAAAAASRDRYVINVDSATTVEILPPVGLSQESAIRLVSGDLSLFIPPSTTPLTPPPSWRADLVLLGNQPPPAFTTPEFLDSTGAAALVAGLGPGGTAVIIPGDSLSDTVASAPPTHQSSGGAAVRLRQTGAEYSITFVRS